MDNTGQLRKQIKTHMEIHLLTSRLQKVIDAQDQISAILFALAVYKYDLGKISSSGYSVLPFCKASFHRKYAELTTPAIYR
jgi:hypothetical protein